MSSSQIVGQRDPTRPVTFPAISIVASLVLLGAIAAALNHYAFDWINTDDVNTIIWFKQVFVTHQRGLTDLLFTWENSHPIGLQVILTTLILKTVGINLLAILNLTVLIIAGTSALLAWQASRDIASPVARTVLWPLLLLMSFHPTQAEHLLWPFEIGWFLVNLFLVLNAVLLERYRGHALPALLASCLLASFCSAQGSLLWFVAAAHLMVMPRLRHRAAAAGLFALLGVLAGIIILHKVRSLAGPYSSVGTSPTSLPIYLLMLLGGIFGRQGQTALLVAGIATIGVLLYLGARVLQDRRIDGVVRIGASLVLASFLFVASFALGRAKFGVEWATSTFHDAPLLVPLLFGCVILSLRLLGGGPTKGRLLDWMPIAFLLASVASSIPYAHGFARISLMTHGLAMRLTCDGTAPSRYIDRTNGLLDHHEALVEAMPLLRRLCTDTTTGRAALLLNMPHAWVELAASHPDQATHLHDLWETYTTRLDLLRAFPVDDPGSPDRLLAWGRVSPLQQDR